MNIETIGRKLVRCNYQCEGITNKPEDGIPPPQDAYFSKIGQVGKER